LSVIPVALIGWLYGLPAGVVAGLLALPVNTALIDFNYGEGWDAVLRDGGGAGSVAIVVIGAIVGHLADVHERLRRQSSAMTLAAREREERARLEGVLLAANTMQHHLCNQLTLTRGYTWLLANSEELTDLNAEMAREAERGVIEASETLDRLLRLTSLVEDTSDADLPTIIDLGPIPSAPNAREPLSLRRRNGACYTFRAGL
jgi:hypothetical protein